MSADNEDRRMTISDETKALWITLARQGKTISEIAEATGLTRAQEQNIRLHLKKVGVQYILGNN